MKIFCKFVCKESLHSIGVKLLTVFGQQLLLHFYEALDSLPEHSDYILHRRSLLGLFCLACSALDVAD